jgi:hypothetical protein
MRLPTSSLAEIKREEFEHIETLFWLSNAFG